MAKNQPNHFDPEIERRVISSMIQSGEPYEIFAILNADDFVDPFNRACFRSIKTLFDSGVTIGMDTLSVELQKSGVSIDPVIYSQMIGYYVSDSVYQAKTVKNFSLCRSLSKIIENTRIELLADFPDALEVADDIQAEIMRKVEELLPVSATMEESINSVIDRAQRVGRGELVYPKSGIRMLDTYLGGFIPGQLIVIAARPSVGKTALALSFTRNLSRAGIGTSFFSLEMGIDEILLRLLSMESGEPMRLIADGIYNDYQTKNIAHGLSILKSQYPDFVCEDCGFNGISALRGRILRNIQRKKTKVVIIDYLQLMDAREGGLTRDLQIGYLTRNLKQIARDCRVPIILLSQLNRNIESRSEKKPMLSDLRDSGNIEQDADVVIFISRDKESNSTEAELIVAKNRNGATGDVPVVFVKQTMLFSAADLTHSEEPAPRNWTDI